MFWKRLILAASTVMLVAGSVTVVGTGTASACIADADNDCYMHVTGTVTSANLNVRAAPWGTIIDNLPNNYSGNVDCYVKASDGSYWDWIYDSRTGQTGWVYDPYLYTGGNIYQQVDEVHEGNCAPPPVTTPTNVTATATSTSNIHVTWTDTNSGYASYVISNGNVSSADQPAGATSYNWGGLGPNTYMCFTVAGKQGGIQSPWSPYGCTTSLPGVPGNVTATALTAHTVRVTWSAPPGGAGQYLVGNGNATSALLSSSPTSYLWRGIPASKYMCFDVAAKNASGYGAWSSYSCVTTPSAPANDYVNLGDSMSSGEGTQNYNLGNTNSSTNQCHRSTTSYSGQYTGGLSSIYHSVDNVACSGAVTNDFYYAPGNTNSMNVASQGENAQYLALSPATDLVTVTLGINNVDFADILNTCYGDNWGLTLQIDKINSCFVDYLTNSKPIFGGQTLSADIDAQLSTLTTLYQDIHTDAPNAQIVVVTYPLVFPRQFNTDPETANTGNCVQTVLGGEYLTSQQQLDLIYAAEDHLDSVIKQAAANANVGVRILNEENAFLNGGHDICAYIPSPGPDANVLILNGLSPGNDSFHPNNDGYSQVAHDLRNLLGY
jgi:lysophospholipase L1-like esterase